jgi:gas vesicle protein
VSVKNWRPASDETTLPDDDRAAPAPNDRAAAAPDDDRAAAAEVIPGPPLRPELRNLPSPLGGAVADRMADGPVAMTVRAVVRATPETLTVARHRAQPRAVYIARLTLTAIFAYLIARQVAGSAGPILAPLTALLVVQVSLSHTLRSAAQRVTSVVSGVLLAIGLSVLVGFTWWSLGILIAVALVVGLVLRLGNDLLEVPISAMLILSSVGSTAAATDRVIETLIGAGAGMLGGLLFAPVRLQSAEDAVEDLSGQLAGLLDQMATDVDAGADGRTSAERLSRARALGGEIQRVEEALNQAEESLRLNPRARMLPQAGIPLRTGLETLEHAAVTVRVIARWMDDASRPDLDSPLRDPDIRGCLAEEIRELAAAVGVIGDHVRAGIAGAVDGAAYSEQVESELEERLSRAAEIQDRLAELLRSGPAPGLPDWSLRGELLRLLDRLRHELQDEHQARARERWPVRGSARRRLPGWGPRNRPRNRRVRRYDRAA